MTTPLDAATYSGSAMPALLPAGLFSELEKAWPQNRAINLVFHGHSVPAGYHKTPDVRPFESYPHLVHKGLKNLFPLSVINCIITAIGGEDSERGAARFEQDVLPHRPDIAFIDYALNDRGQPQDLVEKSWRLMIEAAKIRKIPLVLITPTGAEDVQFDNPEDPLLRCADMIRALGRTYEIPVADVFARWMETLRSGVSQASLLSQSNHPNLAGHQLAADVILGVFERSSTC